MVSGKHKSTGFFEDALIRGRNALDGLTRNSFERASKRKNISCERKSDQRPFRLGDLISGNFSLGLQPGHRHAGERQLTWYDSFS